jgi:nucleotide-binding universal stress UspA family protein
MRQGVIITIGYDGSRCANRALDWAAAQAARRDGVVRIVSCFEVPTTGQPWFVAAPGDLASVRDSAERLVSAAAESCARQHPQAAIEQFVALGPPSIELVDEADGSDLLVVGRHGHRRFDSWRLGSVADSVARHTPCPVVVVPDRRLGPACDRIVVGVDGSAASDAALAWAGDEADERRAELVVVHCWSYAYGSELSSAAGHDLTGVDAALELQTAVRSARDHQLGAVTDRLVEGHPAHTLIEESHHADLVVVGTRGRGAVRSALFGSTSHRVSSAASCPTVIVRDRP